MSIDQDDETDAKLQLARLLDHSKHGTVIDAVKDIFLETFPGSDATFPVVEHAFREIILLYHGHFPGYLACRTEYHDLVHSLQVFSATARLLDGCVLDGMDFSMDEGTELLLAALLHDSGYIQRAEDTEGTGAKYTSTHVDRSAAFVREHAAAFRVSPEAAERIARIILGTDLARRFDDIPFEGRRERKAAEILAAADILGQMSDRVYLEKLLFLYYEFREAGVPGYDSAFDILKKTAAFYKVIEKRLEDLLGDVSHRARSHFARRLNLDRDLYHEAIRRQMDYLEEILADDSTNFRSKLKRMDYAKAEHATPA